ncbi:hypothetical protein E2542_SST07327 [Spatholobus suberectus]|nr:hypothetical protein E2542_SST07327 [Spatholobus suberectus]
MVTFMHHSKGSRCKHYILDHPLHFCYVKFVWSPLESCNLPSNVNYGLHGAPLCYENKKLHGSKYMVVIYVVGPLAFRPSNCSDSLLMSQTIILDHALRFT